MKVFQLPPKQRLLCLSFGCWLILGVLAINIFVVAVGVKNLLTSREYAIEEVRQRTGNYSTLLADSIGDSARGIDLALQHIADTLERDLARRRWEDDDVDALLERHSQRHPEVSAFRLIDIKGNVRLGKGVNLSKLVNAADRDYFRAHQSNPGRHMIVTEPLSLRVQKTSAVMFSRSFRHPDGSFAGVITAAVPVDYFTQLLSRLDLGQHGRALIHHNNLSLVAIYPPFEGPAGETGSKVMPSELRAVLESGVASTTFFIPKAPDGYAHTVSIRRLEQLPLAAFVTMVPEDYLNLWNLDARNAGLMYGVFLLLSIAAAWTIHRFWQRHMRGIADHDASEMRYRATFETSQDIICINRMDDGLYIDVNQAFVDFHGYPRDEVIGRTAEELNTWADPADRQQFVELLQRNGKCSNFEARFRRQDGELIWWLVSASVIDLDGAPCNISIRRDITEHKQSEEKINQLAFFDQLTGLPNRTLLQDRLKQAMARSQRRGCYGGLLLLDLDHFKTLNDTLGHDMGDLLLKQVAQRLTNCVRAEDTVARFGGDEFVVMLTSLSENLGETASLIELIGGKITAAFVQPFDLKNVSYRTSPSIGVSVFLGQSNEVDTLLKQADLAMYKAKEEGRNTLRFFDPDMAQDVLRRASLEHDLREAVQKQQFVLHYQAQITDDQVIGVEALLRWQHPDHGLVSPAKFIPVLEETGLILPVGQWILETACKQLADWAERPELSHLTLSVNISARQLSDEDFVDQVLMTIERNGAKPERLKLELTESVLVKNVKEIIGKMTALKAKGVGFSLDDFGTGYSSLAYLKRLPLDQLKIDQSFVRDILTDPNDAAIARMVVVLAETLGLRVIAEGVETEAQRDALAQHGCHAYQGYLFSRPMPLEAFESLLKRS